MTKEQKLGILKCIGFIGFHNTFQEIKLDQYDDDMKLLVDNYLFAYDTLAKYIGFYDQDLIEELEPKTIL